MKDRLKLTSEIKKLSEILKLGGVIVYPTDTVCGVGCLFDNNQGIEKIYKLKNRSKSLKLPILIGNYHQLNQLGTNLSSQTKQLTSKYWPGALTLILKNQKKQKIAVRMPNYPYLLKLIDLIGKPIIGTSANFHGQNPVKDINKLPKDFLSYVDGALFGKSTLGVESTIVDCTKDPIKILRDGAVKLYALEIDSSQINNVDLKLKANGKLIASKRAGNTPGSQVLLPLIDKILNESKIKPSNLWSCEVNTGPGSFTGLRVGIAIANSLSYALKIPINNKKIGTIIEPKYQ